MKKVLLILMALLLAISGAVTGCTCEGGPGGGSEADGLKITVKRAYFGQVAGWESFMVEVTLKNTGNEAHFIHFAPFPNLFLQDSDGNTYKTMKAFTGWKESRTGEYKFPEGELDNISVEPNEARDLFLRFWDVPEDVEGLKLIYAKPKTEGGETRVSIKLEIEETEPPSSTKEPSEPEETHEGNVYTAAPKNLQTPVEVAVAFWFWLFERETSKIETILSSKAPVAAEWPPPEEYWEEMEKRCGALQSIEIGDVDVWEDFIGVEYLVYKGEKRHHYWKRVFLKENAPQSISENELLSVLKDGETEHFFMPHPPSKEYDRVEIVSQKWVEGEARVECILKLSAMEDQDMDVEVVKEGGRWKFSDVE